MNAWLRQLRRSPAARSGLLLLAAALSALAWANSPAAGSYQALWAYELGVTAGEARLVKPLLLWVNDGLMAVFFLLVGLEIKRELMVGALSTARRAALPLAAAAGGVVLPALVYLVVDASLSGGAPAGWAIPAATDIAFALGLLALLGDRVPVAAKVFLTAVAVVDDLAAVAILGVVFTDGLAWVPLAVAMGLLAVLVVIGRSGTRASWPFVLLGAALWLAVLLSGLHATLAGVMLAAVIPAGRLSSQGQVLGEADTRASHGPAASLLLRWEHALHPIVLFGIVPIFALANAGVALGGDATLSSPVALAVGLGLLVGKPAGITLGAWAAVAAGVAERPRGLDWVHLHAAGWLAGIGFTMSLFIARVALTGPALDAAKVGLLGASLTAALIGLGLFAAADASSRTSGRLPR